MRKLEKIAKKPVVSLPKSYSQLKVIKLRTTPSTTPSSSSSDTEKESLQATRAHQRLKRPKRHANRVHRPIAKTYKEAKPNKPQKCYACGKRGHYKKGCKAKTPQSKVDNPETQEPSPTQPLVQKTSKLEVQHLKIDLKPIYNGFIQPKKEVKIDDLQRVTKETRNEIGVLKQNLQTLESTSYQSNEESPSDKGVHQTANPRADTIQEPSKGLFLDAITRSKLHKWHSKVRIVIGKDFEFEVIALLDSGADLNCIQEGIKIGRAHV